MLKNNREKLHKIEAELYVLEQQLNDSEHERRVRHDEMQQKESMADFLKLTLANTKRNYNLQTKRSRLVQQVGLSSVCVLVFVCVGCVWGELAYV